MTRDIVDAIEILHQAQLQVRSGRGSYSDEPPDAWFRLRHAIRHLAYPDRDVYPKARRGTKVRPIMQVGHRWLK